MEVRGKKFSSQSSKEETFACLFASKVESRQDRRLAMRAHPVAPLHEKIQIKGGNS